MPGIYLVYDFHFHIPGIYTPGITRFKVYIPDIYQVYIRYIYLSYKNSWGFHMHVACARASEASLTSPGPQLTRQYAKTQWWIFSSLIT
jgi:hypothetical protein